jgi:hypothetical protein
MPPGITSRPRAFAVATWGNGRAEPAALHQLDDHHLKGARDRGNVGGRHA